MIVLHKASWCNMGIWWHGSIKFYCLLRNVVLCLAGTGRSSPSIVWHISFSPSCFERMCSHLQKKLNTCLHMCTVVNTDSAALGEGRMFVKIVFWSVGPIFFNLSFCLVMILYYIVSLAFMLCCQQFCLHLALNLESVYNRQQCFNVQRCIF